MKQVHPVMVALRSLREDRGLTRKDLSRHSGISTLTILRWELGQTSPNLLDLQRVLEVLNLELIPVTKIGPTRT